jgi:hypothetical protein
MRTLHRHIDSLVYTGPMPVCVIEAFLDQSIETDPGWYAEILGKIVPLVANRGRGPAFVSLLSPLQSLPWPTVPGVQVLLVRPKGSEAPARHR